MNYRLVCKLFGIVLLLLAGSMALPLIISIALGDPGTYAFVISILIVLAAALPMALVKPKSTRLTMRDGFFTVAFCWIVVSIFGALPYFISGMIPSFADCLFESISGFTTTGATILSDIEALPYGMLFWRGFTHWLGGMGVLVLMLALMPSMGAKTLHILRAETTGPSPGKLLPHITQTARMLYIIYFIMTLIEVGLLIIAGMPVFDAFVHAFAIAGTGGFSSKNAGIAAYNNVWIDLVATVSMFLFSLNFAIYYNILAKKTMKIVKNGELRFYFIMVGASIIIVMITLLPTFNGNVLQALRHSAFQVSTVVSTTGFSTMDFNKWPMLAKAVLLILMLVGACAGSTGGGIKAARIQMAMKSLKQEIYKMIHPRSISTVRVDGEGVEESKSTSVVVFIFCYFAIAVAGIIIISFDNMDLESTVTSVITSLSNVGPGFGAVGPASNFGMLSVLSKLVLSFLMIVGRLEIYPILLLFVPSFWKKR